MPLSSIDAESYAEIHQLLHSTGLALSPAEVQGTICGMLCGGAGSLLDNWLIELSAEAENRAEVPALDQVLSRLRAQTVGQIDEDDLGLELLLPADDAPTAGRTIAVRDWCHGFLYGFGLSGRTSLADLSAEVREALHDFSEIARLDTAEVNGDETDEQALMELEEYIRMATLLIRTELSSAKPGPGATT